MGNVVGNSHGGIHPIKGTSTELRPGIPHPTLIPPEQRICCVCRRDDARHFCMENEEYMHARCALRFLQTEQGQTVVNHGHTVHLDFRAEMP